MGLMLRKDFYRLIKKQIIEILEENVGIPEQGHGGNFTWLNRKT
jgi:hypothetical protein